MTDIGVSHTHGVEVSYLKQIGVIRERVFLSLKKNRTTWFLFYGGVKITQDWKLIEQKFAFDETTYVIEVKGKDIREYLNEQPSRSVQKERKRNSKFVYHVSSNIYMFLILKWKWITTI